ncbi:MAG: VCBS repeat-containing protein [Planctomycetes bacterium]|nr:VCBS repeat-containing protein [Planctomycetota bacterium]
MVNAFGEKNDGLLGKLNFWIENLGTDTANGWLGFNTIEEVLPEKGLDPGSIVLADLDGNGALDLWGKVLADSKAYTIYLNKGNDAFREPIDLAVEGEYEFSASADLDGDSNPDLQFLEHLSGDLTARIRLLMTHPAFSADRDLDDIPDDCSGGQIPGDGNQDREIDQSDAVWLLGHLFLGDPARLPCEGETAGDPGAGERALLDWNGDENIDLSDVISLLSWRFTGTLPPHVLGAACTRIAGCPEACL